MGSPKAPKTPDYTSAAIAQGQSDRETAQYLTNANRVNQVDPYGQTTWSQSQDPDIIAKLQAYAEQDDQNVNKPGYTQAKATEAANNIKALEAQLANGSRWTQTTTLSPEQQALLTQQTGIQTQQNNRISDLLKTYNPSQGDIGNQIYQQMTNRYDDRFAKDEAAQKTELANQGFQQGSEGYQNTLNTFNQNKNDAYKDAATSASIAGYGQYNTEMNYLAQLLGGVQGPTTPQYQPYSQATPYQSPDLLGAMQGQYQGDLNQTNAQNASRSQTLGTVGTIATAAAIAF